MSARVIPFEGAAAPQLAPEDPTKALTAEATGLMEAAQEIRVFDADSYKQAGSFFASIKAKIKEVEAERRKRVDPLNQTVKVINADYKGITDQLEAVLKVVEPRMLAFQREEERKRQEAEAAAAAEKKRLEDEAREKAQAAEQVAIQATQAAQQATNPVAAYVAQEKARVAMEEAQSGYREMAMAGQAVQAVIPPKVTAAGTSLRKTWKFRITDINQVPREYLLPNEQMLGALARSAKESACVPGVEFFAVDSIGGR